MNDKKFVIDSIKMDLYRVVTATGDPSKEIPFDSVKDFLNHADDDFEKINLTEKESSLRKDLRKIQSRLDEINDKESQLKWAEDVLTVRCRL